MLVKIIFSSKTLEFTFKVDIGLKLSIPSNQIRNKEKPKQNFLQNSIH